MKERVSYVCTHKNVFYCGFPWLWLCQICCGSSVWQEVSAGATHQYFCPAVLFLMWEGKIDWSLQLLRTLTVWLLTNLMWQRGGGNSWGETAKAKGRGGRKCTQKSWDERQRKKKAILSQKDVDTVVLVNFFSLFCRENNILVPWKIIYSRKVDVSQDQDIVLSTESPQPGKCSERKTGFLQNKCALLLLQMWSDCAGQTRTLHSVELHTAKSHPIFDITRSFSSTLEAQL